MHLERGVVFIKTVEIFFKCSRKGARCVVGIVAYGLNRIEYRCRQDFVHQSLVHWVPCLLQGVSRLKKVYSRSSTTIVNITLNIKKIKFLWLVEHGFERKVLCSCVRRNALGQWIIHSNVMFGFWSVFIALCSAGIELGWYERQLL